MPADHAQPFQRMIKGKDEFLLAGQEAKVAIHEIAEQRQRDQHIGDGGSHSENINSFHGAFKQACDAAGLEAVLVDSNDAEAQNQADAVKKNGRPVNVPE